MERFKILRVGGHVGVWDEMREAFACFGHPDSEGIAQAMCEEMALSLAACPAETDEMKWCWESMPEELKHQSNLRALGLLE